MKKIKLVFFAAIIFFCLVPTSFAQETALEPIVLVPGIMGSWNWETMFNTGAEGTWNFFPTDHTWDNMIDALEKAGYEKDKNLFIAFYDWRQSNMDSAPNYLVPTIDKALLNSSTGRVNIIAHSMGGLVARRYIQGGSYRDDVNQLIMMGTPNHGSSDVYTLWSGGEVPNNWDGSTKHFINFYLWYMTTATAQTADKYDTVHIYIPSVRELLPVYPFLTDLEGNLKGDEMVAKNDFLQSLNFQNNFKNLLRINRLTTIAGKGEPTVETIPVVPRGESEKKLWADGKPEPIPPVRNSTNGDNRVLTNSALISRLDIEGPILVLNGWQKLFSRIPKTAYAFEGDLDDFLNKKEVDSTHGSLPTVAIADVLETLDLPASTVSYVPPIEPDNITSFWFASPVQIKITDPQGRTITKEDNNIPEAVYTGESNPNGFKMVIIPNGPAGQYKIELVGTENGNYHMAVANFTNEAESIITVEKEVSGGEKVEYTANVDPSLATPTTVSEPAVTNPETEKTAVELTKDLIASLNLYSKNAEIKKPVYVMLSADLKQILRFLEEAATTRPIGEKYPKLHELKVKYAEKSAIAKLNVFILKIETQKKNKKMGLEVASDLIGQAQAIIAKVKE